VGKTQSSAVGGGDAGDRIKAGIHISNVAESRIHISRESRLRKQARRLDVNNGEG